MRLSSSRTSGLVRALAVLGLSFAYFSTVFQIFRGEFWTSGMGDSMDPEFVNSLLEHWVLSITRLNDPSSPLMFFPREKMLGYSHGLVQHAPVYLPFANSSICFRPIT